jgi:hypothetical protein
MSSSPKTSATITPKDRFIRSFFKPHIGVKRSAIHIAICTILIIFLLSNCKSDISYSSYSTMDKLMDTTNLQKKFVYHFYILDSIVNANSKDTLYGYFFDSAMFMEIHTGIECSGDGTPYGRLYFTKRNWEKWHMWYENSEHMHNRKNMR